jgi:hypothetical protein
MSTKTVKQPKQLAVIESSIAPLALSTNRDLTPGVWKMIGEMAPVMFKSRLFGVMSQEQAAAIMLKGFELGLSVTASFEFVQVIQGKPSLSPRGAMAILLSSNVVKEIKINRLIDAKGVFLGYECTMTRNTGFTHTSKFTLADADRAGLIKPGGGWVTYPENMCMWRAVGFAADVVAPDIIAGMTTLMKMPEAYGVSLTEQGDVIEAVSTPVSVVTMNDLLAKWPAEQILTANDGKIPTTTEEIEAVIKKLESV